jgi:hypothetical protein
MSTEAYRAAVRRYIITSAQALRANEFLDFYAPEVREAFGNGSDNIEQRVLDEIPIEDRHEFAVEYEWMECCYRITRLLGSPLIPGRTVIDNPGVASPRQM